MTGENTDRIVKMLLRLILKWDRVERQAVRNGVFSSAQAAKEAKEKYMEILRNMGA